MNPLDRLAADWPALRDLLDEALALPADARGPWLERLSGPQAALGVELQRLLAVHASAESADFMGTLPRAAGTPGGESPSEDAGPAAGDPVGPWRLLSEIGEGGMGSVWLAERTDGQLKRQVALKLPRLSWVRGLAERMARERDILATLEHPHIARLYDAGVDQHGRPWLALEYVQGRPIDAYARDQALTVRRRVELLLQVCEAVAYAHSRLVVHRDLKPSNILVTPDGQVRLLDFGIAKLMEGDSAKETQLTQLAGRAMTLDYASPEQITGGPIGTASDVYSLGVVAFELLTGVKPYKLKKGSVAELEEAIADVYPPKASDAADDGTTKKALRGDIDAILNMSLKKKPTQRYLTIDAFAQDLHRHLASEPVSAQPDAFAYRARKFLGRYRLQTAAGSVAVSAMVVGAALAVWQARVAEQDRKTAVLASDQARASRAQAEAAARESEVQRVLAAERLQLALTRERELDLAVAAERTARQSATTASIRAIEQAERAQQEARRAEAVQRFLTEVFRTNSDQQADPLTARNLTARDLLDRGAARVETELADLPEARINVMATLSRMYYEMSLFEQSVQIDRRRIELMKQLYGLRDRRLVDALIDLATALNATPWRSDILPTLDEAERILDQIGEGDSPLRADIKTAYARRYQNVAPAKMIASADDAVRIYRAQPKRPHGALATALTMAGRARVINGRGVEADELYAEAIRELMLTATPSPVNLASIRFARAQGLLAQGRFRAVAAVLRESIAASVAKLGPGSSETLMDIGLLSLALHRMGERQEARALGHEALEGTLRAKGASDTLYTPSVRSALAANQYADGSLDEAARQMDAVLATNRVHYAGSVILVSSLRLRATIAAAQGEAALASAVLDEAETQMRRALGGSVAPWRLNRSRLDAARMHVFLGRPADALDALAEVQPPGPEVTPLPTDMAERDALKSRALLAQGSPAAAVEAARMAIELIEASGLNLEWPALLAEARTQHARALCQSDTHQLGTVIAELSVTWRRDHDHRDSPWTAEAEAVLASCLVRAGRAAEADPYIEAARGRLKAHKKLAPYLSEPVRTAVKPKY